MTQKRAGNVINSIAVWGVRLTGAGIFLFLSWYALRYTQYMDPAVGEFPVNIRDSMGQNLFCVIVVLLMYAGFRMAGRRLSNRPKFLLWSSISLLTMVTLWMCIAGHWWISAIVRPPEGDQLYAYVAALSFAEGNYSSILPDGYCGIYPHQLGFTAILELFFKITGTTEFYQWQKLNVLCLGGIVILGYLTVRELGGKWAEQILYCLLMSACFPLIFYTSWVYGELLSIICSLAVGWMLLSYGNRRKKGWLISILPVAVMGMLVRKNFLILLLALALVLVVWGVVQRDRWACLFAGFALILPLLSYQGIYKMYEVRSGYERSAGLPVTSWISMGLQENQGRYGWYYDYPLALYKEVGQDAGIVEVQTWEDIRERLHTFAGSPGYTWNFFREKILSQWNEPLYQSLFFTTNFREEYRPDPDSTAGKITVGGELFYPIFLICDKMQFLLYFGMLLYFCFAVKKDGNMLRHMLAVTLIGGFLFSILWEAKARYIFPYYVVMYPMAVTGYCQMIQSLRNVLGNRKQAGERKKVTELRRVA